MYGRQCILLVLKQFLVELLSRTESHIFYLYVLAQLQPGKGNHLLCKVVYLHGLAHVEDEDVVALSHRRGLQHERAGLGDGHEVADDTGVGDGDGTALGYLLLEERDDRAVGA